MRRRTFLAETGPQALRKLTRAAFEGVVTMIFLFGLFAMCQAQVSFQPVLLNEFPQ